MYTINNYKIKSADSHYTSKCSARQTQYDTHQVYTQHDRNNVFILHTHVRFFVSRTLCGTESEQEGS